jgi:hypothetical protein
MATVTRKPAPSGVKGTGEVVEIVAEGRVLGQVAVSDIIS